MANSLVNKKCKACEGGIPPLEKHEVDAMMAQIDSSWKLSDDIKKIRRIFDFTSYYKAIAFVNAIAWMAQQQGHHPDLAVYYGKVIVTYTTHAVDGLTENDFICASLVDQF